MCKRPVRNTFVHEARRCLGESGRQEGDGRPEPGLRRPPCSEPPRRCAAGPRRFGLTDTLTCGSARTGGARRARCRSRAPGAPARARSRAQHLHPRPAGRPRPRPGRPAAALPLPTCGPLVPGARPDRMHIRTMYTAVPYTAARGPCRHGSFICTRVIPGPAYRDPARGRAAAVQADPPGRAVCRAGPGHPRCRFQGFCARATPRRPGDVHTPLHIPDDAGSRPHA
jgi:hypothetical protein